MNVGYLYPIASEHWHEWSRKRKPVALLIFTEGLAPFPPIFIQVYSSQVSPGNALDSPVSCEA